MKLKKNSPIFLITFGILLFAAVMNFHAVLKIVQNILGLLSPILIGLLTAFVLNVPMVGFEKIFTRIFSKAKHKPSENILQKISLVLTLFCILMVIAIACTLLIPTLIESVRSIYPLVREKLPEWTAILKQHGIDTPMITEWITSIDVSSIPNDVGELFSSAVSVTKNAVSGVASIIFGIVIAIYVLLSKRTLSGQIKKLTDAYMKPSASERLYRVAGLIRETYAKFLSGQCVEAVILGCLIALAFNIFRVPYATLIGFLTALFAFVPYIGAFASLFIGAVLVLLADPSKLLPCLIIYLVIQFVENQFIYPHVVGGSVGLAPLWTLIAALIGGNLFGLAGIVFFIPLAAVLYTLLKNDVNIRLSIKRSKPSDTSA